MPNGKNRDSSGNTTGSVASLPDSDRLSHSGAPLLTVNPSQYPWLIIPGLSPVSRVSTASLAAPVVYRERPVKPLSWQVKVLAAILMIATAAITALAAAEFARKGQDLTNLAKMTEEQAENTATGVMGASGALTLAQAIFWLCYWLGADKPSSASVAPESGKSHATARVAYGTFPGAAPQGWTTIPLDSPRNSDKPAPV